MSTLFTSESVSEGHPDKVCDAVSDALLDLHLEKDPCARTAIETMATTNRIIIAGETSAAVCPDADEIETAIRRTVKNIGYEQTGFNWKDVQITNLLHTQSADIALGVDRMGAGDQGIMFGYAKNEPGFDCCYMPLAIKLAHKILSNLSQARHRKEICGLGPDAKSQVTVEYDDNGHPVGIRKIVVSTQHSPDMTLNELRPLVKKYIAAALPDGWMPQDDNILINPTGRFVIGGPDGDCGLTGRKIIVDTYGGYAPPRGGGSFREKMRLKLTALPLICSATWPKTLWRQVSPTNVSSRFHTPSAFLIRCLFTSIRTIPQKSMNSVF